MLRGSTLVPLGFHAGVHALTTTAPLLRLADFAPWMLCGLRLWTWSAMSFMAHILKNCPPGGGSRVKGGAEHGLHHAASKYHRLFVLQHHAMPLNGGEVAPGGGGHVEGGTERGLGPSRAAAEARQAVRHTNAFLTLENGLPPPR